MMRVESMNGVCVSEAREHTLRQHVKAVVTRTSESIEGSAMCVARRRALTSQTHL